MIKQPLYETVNKELGDYPPEYFCERLRICSVSLQVTEKCTNHCRHCANYGSPQNTASLDFAVIKKVIVEMLEQKYSLLLLWGGEPFLYKYFYETIKFAFASGIKDIGVNTNCFWAVSEKAVEGFIKKVASWQNNDQRLTLSISCDRFHQEQEASTPVKNIVNLIAVLEREGLDYDIQSIYTENDTVFESVLTALRERNVPVDNVKKRRRVLPLEYIGRAAQLSHKTDFAAEYNCAFLNKNPEILLFVTAGGQAVFAENFVGDKLLPFGNIKNQSLADIENEMNSCKILKLIRLWPKKFFFYPFRKYLDLQDFCCDLSDGKIKNAFYVRDKVTEILQIKEKQFDMSDKLQAARRIYSGVNELPEQECLDIIERYGDLSDVFYLRELNGKITTEQKIQTILATTFSMSGNQI
ncbi:putative radical SAM protein [Candidatus Termititenax aidoneus]|uniref:Radical SAM protein n=1 Tax=Termititenax aidoneus TaxID=2218524 RepID=A0A388T926_TERA1|nr:putative radical SAM protein [Candidatus Termititenax aidoneus]